MPKTSKRAETKRAAKVARAHATQLPKLQVKEAPSRQRAPGNKRQVRGIARYPWATFLTLVLIAAGVYGLYFYKIGPFAPPAPKPKVAYVSPCLKVVSQLTDLSPAPGSTTYNNTPHSFAKAPAMFIDTKELYCVGLNTSRGLIVMELDPKLAPNTVNNFVFLAEQGYYDGMVFHRVVPGFVIQTGDPLGSDPAKRGSGGPGYKFNDETVKDNYAKGCVAMANNGANTNGSQFFICTGDNLQLPKQYNLFGHVVQGINVALQIQGPGDDAASKNITPDFLNHVLVVPVHL
jgi:peptidylprolyl isomerase